MMRTGFIPRSAFQTRKPPRAGRPAWKCAEEYRRWLRKLDCVCCGKKPGDELNRIVAAHVDHGGKGSRDAKGEGTKAADRYCIPLCNDCHRHQHTVGWPEFEKSLPICAAVPDAPAIADIYWIEWPGRPAWERQFEAEAA